MTLEYFECLCAIVRKQCENTMWEHVVLKLWHLFCMSHNNYNLGCDINYPWKEFQQRFLVFTFPICIFLISCLCDLAKRIILFLSTADLALWVKWSNRSASFWTKTSLISQKCTAKFISTEIKPGRLNLNLFEHCSLKYFKPYKEACGSFVSNLAWTLGTDWFSSCSRLYE